MSKSAREMAEFYDQFWQPENRAAQDEHDFHGFQYQAERALWALIENGGGLDGKRLLEIGPGRARDTEAFARAGATVVAIDVSIKSVELARERLVAAGLGEQIRVVVADAANLPFRDGVFDRSFSRFTIAHIPLEPHVQELARTIQPGGSALLLEPLSGNPLVKVYRRFAPTGCAETAPRYLSLAELRQLARHFPRGWRHRELYLASVAALGLRGTPFFRPAAALLQAIDLRLSMLPPLRSLCWVVVAELRR